jgi:carbapenam-3-carboxylate synthase
LKVSSNEIKVCLREFASKNDLLPQIIASRKKIGIHEGSSVNTIFSEVVGSNEYSAKTKFTYFAYKYMLESCRNLNAASSGEILAQFRRH